MSLFLFTYFFWARRRAYASHAHASAHQIKSVVTSHSSSLEARAVRTLHDLLRHGLGRLHVSLRSHLARLVLVLGGLDGEQDVLALAIHANGTLLANSHALGAIRDNSTQSTHEYTLVTFSLSVEKVVTLQPCFCFLRKAEWFLTMFQTSSEDIYERVSSTRISRFVSLKQSLNKEHTATRR